MSHVFLQTGQGPQRPDWLAGAPGLEPGNGGIKIQMVRVICQRAFRKNAEIRPQSDQEVSGNFGMQGRVAPCCDAPRPPKAEVTRSKSCRARQRINGTCYQVREEGFERSLHARPPRSEEQQPSKLKVAGSNPAGVANDIKQLARIWTLRLGVRTALG